MTNLSIKLVIQAPQGQNSATQLLTLELTDEDDPYFIYSLDISEQDYHLLKQEQQIMVDFQQFPNQFVELLSFCDPASPNGQTGAFVCVFELGHSNEAVFKIVQTNQFKASDHLRLRFKRGNDESIKKYLAEKYKQSITSLAETQERNLSLEQAFKNSQETNEQLMFDIQQLREENRRIVDQMKIEEQKKVNEVKEKMLVEQSEMQARNDHEKKDHSTRSELQIKELQDKLLALTEANNALQDAKRDLETENKEQTQKIAQQ